MQVLFRFFLKKNLISFKSGQARRTAVSEKRGKRTAKAYGISCEQEPRVRAVTAIWKKTEKERRGGCFSTCLQKEYLV
jgi:hypothetical protein